MSTPSLPTTRQTAVTTSRRPSTAYAIAAILNLVLSLFSILWSLPVIGDGASNTSAVPWPVIVGGFALAVLGLPASYGIWRRQRWGVVLAIVLNAVNFISGAPGILFGPTPFLVISSIVLCVLQLLVIYLLLRRGRARSAARPAAQA